MRYTVTKPPVDVPDGAHRGIIQDVIEEEHEWGPSVRFTIRLDAYKDRDGGPAEIPGFASAKLTSQTKLGKWVCTILGRPLVAGEDVPFDALLGRPVVAVVENVPRPNGDGTWAKATNLLPPPAAGAPTTTSSPPPPADLPFAGPDDHCALCSRPLTTYTASGVALCEIHAATVE